MQHPDEGTIHAWLDGVLDEAEAARVAEHVAGCRECESRVVEARGLIAGTSRVLAALDAVPAGVIPAAREAAPDESTPARPGARTAHWWRRRGVTPALAAAAAVAFVAVGSSLVLRERGVPARSQMAEMVRAAPAPARDTTASPQVVFAPAPPAAATPQPRSSRSTAPVVAPTVIVPHRETETRDRVQANVTGSEQRVASAPTAAGVVSGVAPRSDVATASAQPAAPTPLAPSAAAAEAPTRTADAGYAERKAAAKSPTDSAARIELRRSTPDQLESVVATSAGASRADANAPTRALRGAAQRGVAAPPAAPNVELLASVAGCYEIVEGDTAFLPRRFVLDTAPAMATVSDRSGGRVRTRIAESYVAYKAGDRSVVGSWSALGPVVRVVWQREGASGNEMAVLQLRAGTAPRFTATLAVGDAAHNVATSAARSVTVSRCTE